ncbi:hypothetical protein [Natronobiforma cellulositropha]|uniref:hypothetical protein n=1 Tax=Natronobiforma cellulositropha TaxID=1679076 RepID=UPI0021D57B1F|nr:hypothetical protein [Natronobiforma cellulositropha]
MSVENYTMDRSVPTWFPPAVGGVALAVVWLGLFAGALPDVSVPLAAATVAIGALSAFLVRGAPPAAAIGLVPGVVVGGSLVVEGLTTLGLTGDLGAVTDGLFWLGAFVALGVVGYLLGTSAYLMAHALE